MNEITTQTLIITVGIELAVVMALIGIFLFFSIKKGKNADRNAAHELVKNVKSNDKNRREGLLKVFGECYDMDEDELNAAVDEFLNREKAFYKTLISVYVDRDASEFSKLSTSLEEMVKPYSDLALSAEVSVDDEELQALQAQNRDLEKELGESKQVMDELMSEYTATFDKKAEGKTPKAVQEPAEEKPPENSDEDMEETFEIKIDSVPTDLPDASPTKDVNTVQSKVEESDTVENSDETIPDAQADITAIAEDAEEVNSGDEVIAELTSNEAELTEENIDISLAEKPAVQEDSIDISLTEEPKAAEEESIDISLTEKPAAQTETSKEVIDELISNEVSLDDLDEELEEMTT